jgi:predicted phage-related endonuclease
MPSTKDKGTVTATATLERAEVKVTGKMLESLERFVEVRDLINSLTKEKKALDEALKDAMGDAEVGTYRGKVVVELQRRSRTSIDTDLLREAFPEAAAATERTTTYGVIVAK